MVIYHGNRKANKDWEIKGGQEGRGETKRGAREERRGVRNRGLRKSKPRTVPDWAEEAELTQR